MSKTLSVGLFVLCYALQESSSEEPHTMNCSKDVGEAEDRTMDEVASATSAQGPQETVVERTPTIGDSHTLMGPCSISPCPGSSAYGI